MASPTTFVSIIAAQLPPVFWTPTHIFQCLLIMSISKCFKSNMLKAKAICFPLQSPLLELFSAWLPVSVSITVGCSAHARKMKPLSLPYPFSRIPRRHFQTSIESILCPHATLKVSTFVFWVLSTVSQVVILSTDPPPLMWTDTRANFLKHKLNSNVRRNWTPGFFNPCYEDTENKLAHINDRMRKWVKPGPCL